MCISSPKAPDTSAQEAEAARQREEERRRYEQQLAEQRRIAEEQRAVEERRAAQQNALYEKQFAQQNALLASSEQQRRAEAAQREAVAEAERQRQEAEARQRAELAQQYSQGRTQRIQDFRGAVDQAYAGFDDNYFDQFSKDYLSYYQPKLQSEFQDAQDQLVFRFANQGGLRSSASTKELEKLVDQRKAQEIALANNARNASLDFRTNVDTQRKNLLSEALSASNIGPEVLPEGVSDVGTRLGQLSETLTPYKQLAVSNAGSVTRPSFGNTGGFFDTSASGGGNTGPNSSTQFYNTNIYQPRTGSAARVVG